MDDCLAMAAWFIYVYIMENPSTNDGLGIAGWFLCVYFMNHLSSSG